MFRYCPNFEDITQYLFMKYWPILALHGPVQAKLIVWFSNGLTCISQNKCILCNCNAFNASNNNIRMPIVTSRWNALLEEEKCKDWRQIGNDLAEYWHRIGLGLIHDCHKIDVGWYRNCTGFAHSIDAQVMRFGSLLALDWPQIDNRMAQSWSQFYYIDLTSPFQNWILTDVGFLLHWKIVNKID